MGVIALGQALSIGLKALTISANQAAEEDEKLTRGQMAFSMTLAFVGIWLFSIVDRSARAAADRAGFEAQQVRSETGIGAAGASGH